MEEKEKVRSKVFNLILYPDDPTHVKALDIIKQSYDYCMILHDKDKLDTGELKKEHYHVTIRFKNAKWNTSVAKELGILENYMQVSRSIKRSLLYQIHYYDEDKAQYDIKEVVGPLKKLLEEYIQNEGKNESEKVMEIFEEIDKNRRYVEFRTFCKHISSIGYWDVLRRSSGLIVRYLDNHNREFYRKK